MKKKICLYIPPSPQGFPVFHHDFILLFPTSLRYKGEAFEVMNLVFYTNVTCKLHICGTDVFRARNSLLEAGHNSN